MSTGAGFMANAFWHADFEFRRDHLRVRQTGAIVRYNLEVGRDAVSWTTYYLAVQAARVGNALSRRRGPRIAFVPAPPRPWYLFWVASRMAGARFVNDPAAADVIMHFEDATRHAAAPPPDASRAPVTLNLSCSDVSKSKVARVFEDVFGYGLTVDPAAYDGPAVEKSEQNGAHDGRIVSCPAPRAPDRVYQRLIDNTRDDGLVEDIRCPTVFGEIPVVFLKRRPVGNRFANMNTVVEIAAPDDVLSAEERSKLKTFAAAMGLDWGGLDVLRDRRDGRIYVVDVNKTDMGPPLALPLKAKLEATHRLADALDSAIAERLSNRDVR
jgi:hypothetical protein